MGWRISPTLVSNVETFAWVPYICLNGGHDLLHDQGVNGWGKGAASSRSREMWGNGPGVYEVAMGLTLRELIYDEQYCSGNRRR